MSSTTLSARLKFLAVAGVGFFADGYLNLCIGLGTLFEAQNMRSESNSTKARIIFAAVELR
jgi:hypothetical protein